MSIAISCCNCGKSPVVGFIRLNIEEMEDLSGFLCSKCWMNKYNKVR